MRPNTTGGPPTALLWLATLLVIAGAVAGYVAYRSLWPDFAIGDVTLGEIVAIGPLLLLALVLMLLVASWRGKARVESDRAAVAEARVESLSSSQPGLLLFEADEDAVLTYVSDNCHSLLGFEAEAMVGRSLSEFVIDDLATLLPSEPSDAVAREGAWTHADGKPRTLEAVIQRDPVEGPVAFRGAARDIGDRLAIETTLRETHQSFLDMLESAQNGILIVEGSGKILLWNRTICDLLGWGPEQLRRSTLEGLPLDGASGSLMSLVTARMWGAAPAGRYQRQLTRPDGEVRDVELSISTYPLGDSKRSGWIEISDVTAQKRATERIQQLADFDHLTGLPNRQLMERSIADVLEQARLAGGSFAVMLMDLDRFKLINDTLGHAAGDQLLQEVAARFVDALPSVDIVARFGGDEFLVLLPSVDRLEDAMQAAGSLVNSLATPLEVNGRKLHTATSIGVALYPQDGGDAATLIRRADAAMYRAKELGGSGYQFASASGDADSHHRLNIENDLRQAIEAGELTVYYHPEVDMQTGRIVSFEALVRWDHPEHGLLPPLDFIPILEDNGLIRLVDEWVLREACTQNERWRAEGLGPVVVSVNLSARLFSNEGMLDTLKSVIVETGIQPEQLELEVTETAALNNVEEAVAILQEIRELGVRTALDDFGTGHSSLVRLKEFPLSTLKIDGSFVQNVTSDEDSGAIVTGVIALGHALGLTVVAEGVEQKRQFSLLRNLGCDLAQGYLFARPLTAEDATELLSEHRRLGEGYAA